MDGRNRRKLLTRVRLLEAGVFYATDALLKGEKPDLGVPLIAARAGIATRTFYEHFRSTIDFRDAMIEAYGDALMGALPVDRNTLLKLVLE